MFTGLVEALATVRALSRDAQGARLTLQLDVARLGGGSLCLGESIAVNGVCLTVSRILDGGSGINLGGGSETNLGGGATNLGGGSVAAGFVADVSAETFAVSTLSGLRQGDAVNVERAMVLGGRLGGHLVTGHVDGVATVTACEQVGDARRVTLEPPAPLMRFLAAKGSVTLDGVSLTVNRLLEGGRFEVMLVPHTQAQTSLSTLRSGRRLNVEVDVLARYAARLMEAAGVLPASAATSGDDAMMKALKRGGYL